jgi:hypothetical protein
MKILFDTNVLLDAMLAREPYYPKSGDGSAVSLQCYFGVGKRHCRLLG